MRLYRQTVEDFGLYTGKELQDDELKNLRAAAGQMSSKMRAVRIISASSVSKADLERRLVEKGENRQDARQALSLFAREASQQLVLVWTRAGGGRTGGRAGDLEAAA